MKPIELSRVWVIGCGAAVAAVLLAGCVTEGQVNNPNFVAPAPAAPANSDSKDRVTASDESAASKKANVRLELATAYFSRGQMTTALDQVKLAIAADPTHSAAFSLRGLIYASLGDDKLAEESFQRALQISPRDADTMQNFGWFLCQKKRYTEADAMFVRALAVPQYRDAPRTMLAQGVCQSYAGQPELAERTLQRSFELDPANPSTAVNLAELLFRRGAYDKAKFYIQRVNNQPEVVSAQTLWLAARIENKMGNESEVKLLGTKLRDRFPESPESAAFEQGRVNE
jgi:type IV pilus assembly protein PilF